MTVQAASGDEADTVGRRNTDRTGKDIGGSVVCRIASDIDAVARVDGHHTRIGRAVADIDIVGGDEIDIEQVGATGGNVCIF